MIIRSNLKEVRQDHDITQQEVAAILGVAQNTYSQYENGKIELTAPVLIQLADYYQVSIDYLLGHAGTGPYRKFEYDYNGYSNARTARG